MPSSTWSRPWRDLLRDMGPQSFFGLLDVPKGVAMLSLLPVLVAP